MTIDLRRYLPGGRAGGISNMSAVEPVFLGRVLGEDLDATLVRVASETGRMKERWMGLDLYGTPLCSVVLGLSLERYTAMFTKKYRELALKGTLPPAVTNMGAIRDVAFDRAPLWARLLVPPMYPPAVVLGLSGYEETLCLSAVAFPRTRETVERYVAAILDELEEV